MFRFTTKTYSSLPSGPQLRYRHWGYRRLESWSRLTITGPFPCWRILRFTGNLFSFNNRWEIRRLYLKINELWFTLTPWLVKRPQETNFDLSTLRCKQTQETYIGMFYLRSLLVTGNLSGPIPHDLYSRRPLLLENSSKSSENRRFLSIWESQSSM